MFAVMGATGSAGRATIKHLRKQGARVRAVTRDPSRAAKTLGAGIEFAKADVRDEDSLVASFRNVEAAFVMVPLNRHANDCIDEGRTTAKTIVAAIRRSGVPRVVLLSSVDADRCGSGLLAPLVELEESAVATDTDVTVLRASSFMENWGAALSLALRCGLLPSPRLPLSRAVEMVSVQDIGATAARSLSGAYSRVKYLKLLGPRPYSSNDVAAVLSALADKRIEPIALDRGAMRVGMLSEGYSQSYVEGFLDMSRRLNSMTAEADCGLGMAMRGPTTLTRAMAVRLRADVPEQPLWMLPRKLRPEA